MGKGCLNSLSKVHHFCSVVSSFDEKNIQQLFLYHLHESHTSMYINQGKSNFCWAPIGAELSAVFNVSWKLVDIHHFKQNPHWLLSIHLSQTKFTLAFVNSYNGEQMTKIHYKPSVKRHQGAKSTDLSGILWCRSLFDLVYILRCLESRTIQKAGGLFPTCFCLTIISGLDYDTAINMFLDFRSKFSKLVSLLFDRRVVHNMYCALN